MADKPTEKTIPESFFADWIKMTTELWGPMASMWTGSNKTAGVPQDLKKDKKRHRMQETWDTTQKTWQTFSRAMSDPETLETLFKGTGMLPELFLKTTQTGLNTFVHLQQQWIERARKVQKSTQACTFENLDEDVVKSWTQLYEAELRKFFNMPQVGLTRFYQEKMVRSMDKFNMFQATVTEFLRLLSLPMEKSFQVMQEKLTELAEEGNLPKDSKAYYQMWIKILEGHYMVLFQSPEYTRVLNKTLNSMSEFSDAKKDLLQDTLLYMLPVPTQKEMDDLYKEIYLLKKRIKALEKRK